MKRLIAIACFLLAGAPAWGLTLAEIETRVRYYARDTGTTASLQSMSDTVLDGLINEVQRDVVNQTWCVESSTSITLSAGTTYYSLPTDLIVSYRATFTDADADVVELEETTLTQMVKDNPDYESNSSGEPSEYFIRQSPTGGDSLEMAIYPIPTSASTGTVTMDYAAMPADMSSDSDVPFGGLYHLYPYHEVLVWGAVARVKLIQNKGDEAVNYTTLYTNALGLMKAKLNEIPNYRPNFQGRMK